MKQRGIAVLLALLFLPVLPGVPLAPGMKNAAPVPVKAMVEVEFSLH